MKKKGSIYFLSVMAAAVLWGTAGIFVRTLENENFSQMEMVLGRAFISAVLLGIIILFKDISLFKVRFSDLWLFIAAGIFSIVLFNFSYYTTMSLTSLSVAAVLLYTAPFFVVIISLFLFKERLNSNKIIALFTAFLGCCFVSGFFDTAHRISGKALFFGLLTGLGYALYTVFSELLLKRGYKTLTITFYVFFFAAVCSLLFVNPIDATVRAVSSPLIAVMVFLMALFNTVFPYILYTTGLMGVSPTTAPIIATVEPVVATLIGGFIFKEDITTFNIIGIALVLLSVAILNVKPLTITANAKINLTLGITGKREDGYHLIDTVMQSVSLYDKVMIIPWKSIVVKCSNKGLGGKDNIAYKAANLFFEQTGIEKGALIYIKKNIPEAAGMGGGSADAAAVLRGLNSLYKTNLSNEILEEMAISLGADVPFFIKGGTQRAEGIGEVLSEIKPLRNVWFVLVKEDKKPSTAEMYKKLDSKEYRLPDTENAIKAIEEKDFKALSKCLENSFSSVWQESKTKEKLEGLGANAVSLSGSGPTWFAMFEEKPEARMLYKKLKKQGVNCYLAKSSEKAIEFE